MSATRFEGQVAVVSGGTRGLGAAITQAFLTEGARVHALYRSNESAAQAFADALPADQRERLALARVDVSSAEEVAGFWGRLDELEPEGIQILVNNAGIRRDAILALMNTEDWSSVIETNLSSCFYMCQHGVKNMLRSRYGRIVQITSPAGSHGFEGQANYSASKAGQVGLSRSLAREVAKKKITVNCVSPGFIDTELIGDLPEDVRKAHKASVPMRRFGTPEEVASAVTFLASMEASYITGSVLEVTGGL